MWKKMDPNFESRQLNTTQPKRMKVLDGDLMMTAEVRIAKTTTNIWSNRLRRVPLPPFSSDKTGRHAKKLSPLQPVSGVKTGDVIDHLVRFSVEPVDEFSSQSSGIDWPKLPSRKQVDLVVLWPFAVGTKPFLHESLDSQKQHWSSILPSSHRHALENSSSESSSARTPAVYQRLDFPVTPEVYSFPFLTVSDNDQLRELLNQTLGNINQVIVLPEREQDVEAMQSRTTNPKLGDIDEG